MRLDYKILWFEDDLNWLEEEITPNIKRYLQDELGFNPILICRKDGTDLDSLIIQNNPDLIVSDLNLIEEETNDETGRKIIASIREQNILTEVLLYSSNGEKIKEIKDNEPGVERASFAAGHEFLPTKLREIISLTVKKVQDINNLRGKIGRAHV